MESAVCSREFELIIIGGGATGAGIARDCAMRGLKVLLLEKGDYSSGTTGRNHGLLHSGARYAVSDPNSALECSRENSILKKIAPHCIEDNGGLFIFLPEDDAAYRAEFLQSCKRLGIPHEVIDSKDAMRAEPSVNPRLIGAVRVKDASVDPFKLTIANILDAKAYGAVTKVLHEVREFICKDGRVVGLKVFSHSEKEFIEYYAPVIINATGIWGHDLLQKAGITLNMYPSKGSMLVFGHRLNNMVLNRCRRPGDADILVPGETVTVMGTSSSRVPYGEADDLRVSPEEVDLLLREAGALSPALSNARILRAYAGVRPLVSYNKDASGRSISRDIALFDHGVRDSLEGLISITGGKLTTYRLMAQLASDLVCSKLVVKKECKTAQVPLLASQSSKAEKRAKKFPAVYLAAKGRHGRLIDKLEFEDKGGRTLVCECEEISVAEMKYSLGELDVDSMAALRRRTRLGMGSCQGNLCACRAAGLFARAKGSVETAKKELGDFLFYRWKGIVPVLWGEALREAEFSAWIYGELCNLNWEEEDEV